MAVSRLDAIQSKRGGRPLTAALQAVAALDPPPATMTTRKTNAASGHSRASQAQLSRGCSCYQAGTLSAAVIRVKIESIAARSGSDSDSARSARRSSLS